MSGRPWNVAVVGAGPAGIFAADALQRHTLPTRVDVFEKQPVPFGLVRYGIAPDHPLTSTLADPLRAVLDRRDIRLVAGVEIGIEISIERLRGAYDAVVIATGASIDAPLPIPGVKLPGSFGASEFVAWYNSHPDSRGSWDLAHSSVAVIGAGNVALDVTRMLIKSAADLDQTDISGRVRASVRTSMVTDVHLFARRGPAETAFSAAELLALDRIPDVKLVVDPADMVFDRSSENLISASRQRRVISETLREWSTRTSGRVNAAKRIHLHFMQAPVNMTGNEHVDGITVERTRHLVNGTVEGTGYFRHYPVGQVYRAIGSASAPIDGVPFSESIRRIPSSDGRVLDEDGEPVTALYAAGWAGADQSASSASPGPMPTGPSTPSSPTSKCGEPRDPIGIRWRSCSPRPDSGPWIGTVGSASIAASEKRARSPAVLASGWPTGICSSRSHGMVRPSGTSRRALRAIGRHA
jgi:ferredoxin--NADP+ reductase